MKIYLIVLILFGLYFWVQIKKAPDEKAKRAIISKTIIYGFILVVFILAALGRIHWLGAILAALLPIVKAILVYGLRFFPLLARIYSTQESPSTPTTSKSMDLAEARKILDVDATASEEEIQKAYKRQIQKAHPDRGGNEYFASMLNEARDLLISNLKK